MITLTPNTLSASNQPLSIETKPEKNLTARMVMTAQMSQRALLLAAALTLSASIFALPAAAHTPLKKADGKAGLHEALIGEPKGSDIAIAIEERMMDGKLEKILGPSVSEGARDAARQAYAQAVFAPLWTRSAAEQLVKANPTCRDNGFDSGITDDELRAAIDARFSGSAVSRAEADLRLTATWLILASKMSGGLSDEGGMVRSTTNRPTRSDLVSAIRRAAQVDPIAEMEKFAALSPQYDALKAALKQYRQYATMGGWMKLRSGEEMLEPGMDDPRVPALRKRLRAEGYVPPRRYSVLFTPGIDQAPTVYDPILASQVEAFQAAHGLNQDGIIGPSTLHALNQSVESKIDRIERAMAHWRANPNLGDQFIWVNIPSYRAEGWDDGVLDIAMDTIVGKKRTPTPAFSDEIEYIVANPKWFLPIGLFKRQKLRKLRNDPGYAARHNYKIYDRASGEQLNAHAIDWNQPGVARQVRMVQDAGPQNALGQLKIIFPNEHSIYLHDTPSRHLFDEDVRALSSGCIRLKDPVAMANWLTDHDDSVSTPLFNSVLQSRERERFYLQQHVNVHLTYLPATVTPEGKVEFPADIYQNFKTPSLAKGTYSDDIHEDGETPFIFVDGSAQTASNSSIAQTSTGKATLQ